MPILLSLAIFNDWRHALETAGLFLILEIVVSNFIEPLLYGAHVGLSALAILVSAIFWTLIWGIPGLVLATPLTVFLVVMGRYIPGLAFLEVMLGDEPVLPPFKQYYQSLLATDPSEAKRVLELYLKEKSLEELYSAVVIPAMGLAEQDRHHDELSEDAQAVMYHSILEMVEELGDVPAEQSQREEHESYDPEHSGSDVLQMINRAEILCIPAKDNADDVVALMLAQLLAAQGFEAKNVPIELISEMLGQVTNAKPNFVCISALPPFAVGHARELYRRLRPLLPDVPMVVCLWHLEGDLNATSRRLKMTKGDLVFSALPQVLEYANLGIVKKVAAVTP